MNMQLQRELDRDKSLRDLKQGEKKRILAEAVDFGTKVADWVREEFGIPENLSELTQLAEKTGAVVRMTRHGIMSGTLAEYDEATREIFCYVDVVEKIEGGIAEPLVDKFGTYDLISLTVAHELFHHLENIKFGKADQRIIGREVVWLGLFHTRISVAAAREIAAHAFVKRLLDLPAYPIFN